MARPRKHDHAHIVAVYQEIGVIRETARQLGIHEQTLRTILKKNRGACHTCGKPAMLGRTWCADCLAKKREQERELAEEHLRQGLCVKCTEPLSHPSRRHCATHRAAHAEYQRTHRRKRIVNVTGTTLEAEKALRVEMAYGVGGLEAWTRDNGCCVLCDASYANRMVVVHHLDRDRRHNTADNLVCLCYTCHRLVHGLSEHPHLLRFLDWFHIHYPAMALPQKATALLPRKRRAAPQPAPTEPDLFLVS